MPVLELKGLQKELKSGKLWPVYWIHGIEQMKRREALKRIRTAFLPELEGQALGVHLCEEVFDGAQTTAGEVLDAGRSLGLLGGGRRIVIVKDAQNLKKPEELEELLEEPGSFDEVPNVVVFISKDLDKRKKFSKLLLKKAACVPCDPIAEQDHEAWIRFLAKSLEIELTDEILSALLAMDPWSLDRTEQELKKIAIARDAGVDETELLPAGGTHRSSGQFLEALFARKNHEALQALSDFCNRPEEAIPLLGLLTWNLRQLLLLKKDEMDQTRSIKMNPYLLRRMENWSQKWTLSELLALQRSLAQVDYETKQTGIPALSTWTHLVICQKPDKPLQHGP